MIKNTIIKKFLEKWHNYSDSQDNSEESKVDKDFESLETDLGHKIKELSSKYLWVQDLIAMYRYFWDGKANLYEKAGILLVAIYLINPFDLVPDYLPLVGYVDDGILITFLVKRLKEKIDQYKSSSPFNDESKQLSERNNSG